MNLNLSPKYEPLWRTKCRYIIITGGRGSAKSFAANTFLAHLTFQPLNKILFTRYTLVSASMSIIPEFLEKPKLLGCDEHFTETKNNVKNNYSGVDIMFRGIKTSSGNQTANLKSIQGVSTWVIDEAEELVDETTFDTIDLSIRSPHVQNRVIIIMNPTTKEHFLFPRFFESMGVQPGFNGEKGDVCYIHTDYRDNIKNLPESVLRSFDRMKEKRPERYKNVVLGGWLEKAEGVIFRNWTIGDFDNSLSIVFGQDYGYANDPSTLVKVAVNKSKKIIYLDESFYLPHQSTSQITELNKRYSGTKLIVGDNAEPRLIAEIRSKGVNIKASEKGPDSIRIGISRMLDYDMVVTPTSINLIKELNNYAWNDRKSQTPIDRHNHIIDAVRYALEVLIGKRPPKKTEIREINFN